jgi:sulfoxide reductase heme-binding subunit YedZ
MVLIIVSFPIRKRIGMRSWRRLHWATYGLFALATVHGLAAGTDTPAPWAFAIYLGAVGSVVFATAWRALNRPVRPTTTKGGNHVPNSDRPLAV